MANTVHFILLNGPPGSGKSTIAAEFVRALNEACKGGHQSYTIQDSLAAPMKNFVAFALGEKYHQMDKERARSELCGYSVRELLIYMAEDHIKPRYEDDIFARWLHHRVLRGIPLPNFVVVDDLGFDFEATALAPRTIIRVERQGKTFAGDSRNHVAGHDYLIVNDGPMVNLWSRVKSIAMDILEKKGA